MNNLHKICNKKLKKQYVKLLLQHGYKCKFKSQDEYKRRKIEIIFLSVRNTDCGYPFLGFYKYYNVDCIIKTSILTYFCFYLKIKPF